jgi:hypothetical protein
MGERKHRFVKHRTLLNLLNFVTFSLSIEQIYPVLDRNGFGFTQLSNTEGYIYILDGPTPAELLNQLIPIGSVLV